MKHEFDVENPNASKLHWLGRIGPGLITACVVIGPGSILTSSQVGAKYGYSMLWVVIVAVSLMMVFMRLGARLGVVSDRSPCDLITERLGRPAAVFVGLSVGFISASFQFGNNLGVHAAVAVYLPFDGAIVILNALSILFLFGFRNLYRALERLMTVMVGLMLIAFASNLVFASPDWGEVASGFVPNLTQVDVALLGLVGTTLVITAAFYQAYLVRQKGWTKQDLRLGLLDVRIGGCIMALLTLMLIITASAAFRGEQIASVAQVAGGLRPLFGSVSTALFCVGLFSAAYSSFLVNSMIGGFVLADGLGWGSRPTDLWPRIFTACILLIGMTMAMLVIRRGISPVPAIVMAQAVTVIAAPVLAAALIWLTNQSDIMGADRTRWPMNIAGTLGLILLLAMSAYTLLTKILRLG